MNFIPLAHYFSGGSGAGCRTLLCFARHSKALIDNAPKRGERLGFGVKKILKKSRGVQRQWIGVRFPVLASFYDPIVRFRGVSNLKEARGVEIRAALIVQNTIVIGLDSNDEIGQTWGEVWISSIFSTEFNNHRERISFRFSSTRPMPGCSYQ